MRGTTLEETDKAYIAGIIDGEGSICITKNTPKPHWNTSSISPSHSIEV